MVWPDNNELWLADSSLGVLGFHFSAGKTRPFPFQQARRKYHGLNFDNFRLATFTSLLNPDEMVAPEG